MKTLLKLKSVPSCISYLNFGHRKKEKRKNDLETSRQMALV